ncbi:superfamily I DNA and RNA helicases [Coriobacteriaceae bacterium EMTCatB1]|nr:superfamily I DNA and RNA helicases [Coriobacteriaceae bacterium EMTCatB1]
MQLELHQAIEEHFPTLNDDQRRVVGTLEGPLLVIAGPGSGKTLCLVLRTLNALLLGKAEPSEIILCTFTEKAALELRDRLAEAASLCGYQSDLTSLRTGTIHSICNALIQEYRHHTPLGAGFETLDDLTQLLFIYENFTELLGEGAEPPYLGKWGSKWDTIRRLTERFNKLTEELVDPAALIADPDPYIAELGRVFDRYGQLLLERNRVDFSHQQKVAWQLMQEPLVREQVAGRIRYVMVDEYQDTNYVQEQLMLDLSSLAGNLCVVGDEDQALYRFRGATVRNILEFAKRFPECPVVKLQTNYRSHRDIIAAYDRWMASAQWQDRSGQRYRYDKTIAPPKGEKFAHYPAVFQIWGTSARDEAERFADLVVFLKDNEVIEDYNQVALLMYSVQKKYSSPFIEALKRRGIPAFCPRARTYFENEEVRLMVACLATVLGFYEDGQGEGGGRNAESMRAYVDECLVELAAAVQGSPGLQRRLQEFSAQVEALRDRDSLDVRLADVFYRLLGEEPFVSFVKDENRARNLAMFSSMLSTLQAYYHLNVITGRNKQYMKFALFGSMLPVIFGAGMNEFEDKDAPFPSGYVQIMTIHQSKGLEFPVVAVDSLTATAGVAKQVDQELSRFYHREPYEPAGMITEFDNMRLFYVAFSRAQNLLVLSSHERPHARFAPIWDDLQQWPHVDRETLAKQRWNARERKGPKRRFSFTGDLKIYETCPRQYEFFRHYDFTPSRSATIFFGLLVHQTIEEIHRLVLEGRLGELDDARITQLFEKTYGLLTLQDVRPVGEEAKQAALEQVKRYVRLNRDTMARVEETEVDVSVEKNGYILHGVVDLLLGADGKLEVLDFKASKRPDDGDPILRDYERQLCTYAHILERRHGRRPDRLLLYWTGEESRERALMEFPYREELVAEAAEHFDEVVRRILARDFCVSERPDSSICKECDVRPVCVADCLMERVEA